MKEQACDSLVKSKARASLMKSIALQRRTEEQARINESHFSLHSSLG